MSVALTFTARSSSIPHSHVPRPFTSQCVITSSKSRALEAGIDADRPHVSPIRAAHMPIERSEQGRASYNWNNDGYIFFRSPESSPERHSC